MGPLLAKVGEKLGKSWGKVGDDRTLNPISYLLSPPPTPYPYPLPLLFSPSSSPSPPFSLFFLFSLLFSFILLLVLLTFRLSRRCRVACSSACLARLSACAWPSSSLLVARLRSPLSSCDSPWSIWSVVSSAAQLLAGLSVPAFTARLAEIVAVGRSGVLADDVMRLAVVDLVSHIVGKRLAVCAVALGAEFCAWSRSSLLVARLRSSTSACDSAWSIWSETCQKATGGLGCAARRSLRNCVEIVTVGRSAVLADVSTRLGVVDLVCLIVGRPLACSQIAFGLHRALGRDRRS